MPLEPLYPVTRWELLEAARVLHYPAVTYHDRVLMGAVAWRSAGFALASERRDVFNRLQTIARSAESAACPPAEASSASSRTRRGRQR
jgi:hypothetical protein